MEPKTAGLLDLIEYFRNPISQRQKQYEAVRAVVLETQPPEIVAKTFGYKTSTIYSLIRDAKAGKIKLFPIVKKGPQQRRTSPEVQKRIIVLRKQGLSSPDIQSSLAEEGIKSSTKTVERFLKDKGFGKLKRRTNKQLGKSITKRILPDRAALLDFSELEPFNIDCPSVGVFFFLPYILESEILDVVRECKLPESSDIRATQACLSMLLLKLIGCDRLSHIGAYDQEPGFGIFAGLNILPKPTYMNTYSCRCSEIQLMELQNQIISTLRNKYPDFYSSNFINLDFHSIPHYGDESEMEKVWCGAKGKSMKGANTIFAQDSQSNAIIYTRADILRNEESSEVKKFVAYWKSIKGNVDETLVFDCKFTTYDVLDDLVTDGIKFITLRKRYASLIKEMMELPKEKWKKVYVPIPKRKHKRVSVYESEVKLKGCQNTFRQITIKDHGRSKPTFILTNNNQLTL
jgi:transposase